MKFVDEVVIDIAAGNGGAGCASFRREKSIPFGGPNGGDGGRGGSVYVVADPSLNTLIDFRYARRHEAGNGEPGRGRVVVVAGDQPAQRDARADVEAPEHGLHDLAADVLEVDVDAVGRRRLELRVPVGTIITDMADDVVIAELVTAGQRVTLAKGGDGGFGNLHYKTSTNRAPRQKTPGWPGERRQLRLELRVLADVGLLGMPNAGKSTLIAAVSNARPKIADYPFTTLYPNLGVVRAGPQRSFVVADIPGLVEGAAEGAGLGHAFLRHLQRTRLLLHVVDIAPFDDGVDPVAQAKSILKELRKYDERLYRKPRWLVLNKIDMVPESERAARKADLVRRMRWKGPVFEVSALARTGLDPLVQATADHVDASRVAKAAEIDVRFVDA